MVLLQEYPQLKTIQALAKKRKVSVYLVGGFLRDYLLGRRKSDASMATNPIINDGVKAPLSVDPEPIRLCSELRADFDFAVEKDALKLAKSFSQKIRGAFVLLDKEHGCARVVKKEDGTIITFDFADFRAKTFLQDLAHRDFTINTLSIDLFLLNEKTEISKLLKDFKGGLKDLKAKRIKRVSVSSFKEDPLRMLRAFSLQAMLGFKIEPATLKQIKVQKELLKGVSYERIRDEVFKILESERTSEIIRLMDRVGILDVVIPQITVMYTCHQGGYHHLHVWPHSLETVVQLDRLLTEVRSDNDIQCYLDERWAADRSRRAILKLGALLHDIGKPDTRKEEGGGRISFHGHEHVGKAIVRSIAKMLKLSTHERYALEDMVRWHLRPGYLSNFKHPTEKAVYRYFRDTKNEAVSILLLSLADQRATRGPLTTEKDQQHHQKICTTLMKQYFDKQKEVPFVRLVSGHDLIKKLKLAPSPLFGKILRQIDEQQVLGKITTRQEALELAQRIAKK